MNAQDLKNSILQLAIQGKLVEQREEEGTAKELLEKIEAVKKQLLKEGKIKKQKALPPIKEDEIPFDIPESWEWVRLGSIEEINLGFTYRPKYTSKGVRFLSVKDISKGKIDFSNTQFVSEDTYENASYGSKPRKGDILFGRVGTIGKPQIIDSDDKFCIFVSLGFLRDHSELLIKKYICSWMESQLFWKQVYTMVKGATVKNLNTSWLRDFLIPLPPLEEQKRIVAKIEELMPYVDKYDAAYSEVEELNKKFPEDMQKSILQYAIQGKLVEQREEDGTAEDLYQQIQGEMKKLIKEGKIKRTKALSEITENETPFDIPESWKWVRLGDVFEINPRNNVSDEISVSFIPMALIEDGYVSQFTYEVKAWGNVKKGYTHFQDGDIVMAKITPCFQNLKSVLLINLENGIGAGTTELHVLRSHSNICREFFMWFIKSPIFVSTCEKNMTGTAGQKRVPTDVLKSYVIPLPPLAEQQRIVAKIEELLPYTKQLIER